MSVLSGLEFSWKNNFKKLIVQVDNKSGADSLVGSGPACSQGLSLARRIRLLSHYFEVVVFKHVPRDSNTWADFLAKMELPRSVDRIWLADCPIDRSSLRMLDCGFLC